MKFEIRYAEPPDDVKQYGTKESRNYFLCSSQKKASKAAG
jgi:hypothetical protein